jgi:hypothetical protein
MGKASGDQTIRHARHFACLRSVFQRNDRRWLEPIGDVPAAEYEQIYLLGNQACLRHGTGPLLWKLEWEVLDNDIG